VHKIKYFAHATSLHFWRLHKPVENTENDESNTSTSAATSRKKEFHIHDPEDVIPKIRSRRYDPELELARLFVLLVRDP
jgi:hypothetical protein